VDYRPAATEFVNIAKGFKAQRKDNLGVLETTGTLIVDDRNCFDEMKRWQPKDISYQVYQMIVAIAPDCRKVDKYETAIQDLFPA
jgi:flagellar biosynthesis/type III secretory pathway M-ring protein FliF/YscJ